jgi:uncharacterized protein (DUF2147 family)
MKRFPIVLFALLFGLISSATWAQSHSPVGLWKTIDDSTQKERSLVRIVQTNGTLSASIEKILDPQVPLDKVCARCTDDRKDKPLLGLNIIRGVTQSTEGSAMWDGGSILDPGNGKTYKVRLTLADKGDQLKVRGYIGQALFGRTQVWLRVD